jgi:hypothetical protein
VLFGLCVFQCGSMLAIVYVTCGLHSSFLYDFLVLLVASMIGAGLGLSISALARTNESAIALLPVVLLPIIALGGGMRPIYLMPKAGQIVSTIIPSRWSFEANLLHEATAAEWGTKKLMPDLKCKLGSGDAAPAVPQRGANLSSIPRPGDDCPTNDDSALCGDTAESSIPRYLITYDDNGTEQTCRASAHQSYPRTDPTVYAVSYRHRFRDSMAVLGAMLLLSVAAVIVILRKRDNDPQ